MPSPSWPCRVLIASPASCWWWPAASWQAQSLSYGRLEAIQAAAAFHPQVILLDIGLPKMNGYEVARRIREQPMKEKVAIIALTGWGQEKDKQMALAAGCDHHLTKPVDPAALTKLLALIVRP